MNLETLQREMAAAVMLPLTPNEEMCAEAPDGRRMSDVARAFIAPNSRLSAFERLEIYNRQYWFRVLGALAEDFPALRAVIGAQAFERTIDCNISLRIPAARLRCATWDRSCPSGLPRIPSAQGAGIDWRSMWRASSGLAWRHSTAPSGLR